MAEAKERGTRDQHAAASLTISPSQAHTETTIELAADPNTIVTFTVELPGMPGVMVVPAKTDDTGAAMLTVVPPGWGPLTVSVTQPLPDIPVLDPVTVQVS
jgi:hypothetical protein